MKKIGIFYLLTILNGTVFSQSSQISPTNNKIIPQPPDVASLFKFTQVPVSYFNGTANIGVPLYEIKSGDLSFPITIGYHPSGLKVNEEAGIVGLGWNLSTVAAISETNPSANPTNISSLPRLLAPDEFAALPSNPPAGIYNLETAGETFKDINGNCNTYGETTFINSASSVCEPDMFILSANGISGKFFIPNGQPLNNWVSVDASNIKLTGNIASTGSGYRGNFTAVLPDGTQYLFNNIGVTSINSINVANNMFSHSYYLSQIISPTGKTISFKYLSLATVPKTISQQGFSEQWAIDNCANQSAAFTSGATITPSSTMDNLYVDSIYFDNGYCKYLYGNRLDMDGYQLNAINIYNNFGASTPIKAISFQYGYYDFPKGNYGDFITDGQNVGESFLNGPKESYRRLRLKLLSVQVNNDPPCTFGYDNNPIPYKTSFAQDLWGFFNGNTNKTLIPDYNQLGYLDNNVPVAILNGTPHSFQLSNRSADFDFAKAGILNQITYPTGGYTRFQYQPNAFYLNGNNIIIKDTLVAVTDIGVGKQSLVFSVPNVGLVGYGQYSGQYVNPASITVQLICGGNGGCPYTGYSGNCTGYLTNDPNNPNTLYALLQVQDPSTGAWTTTQNNIFDFTNSSINTNTPCGSANIPEQLAPGNYRIVANFPDNLSSGSYGGASAFISVRYKVQQTSTQPNTGGGLRISNITDFSAGGQPAYQRKFSYSAGKMMTTPIFYRYQINGDRARSLVNCVSDPAKAWGSMRGNTYGTGQGAIQNDRTFVVLYNNPILPYSYSANGSPVGYDTVYEQKIDGQGNDQGRTVYNYIASPDNYNFYGTIMPGTPSTPYLDNGSLVSESHQINNGNGYNTIHSIDYNYTIGSPKVFWAYKFEYLPLWLATGADPYINGQPDAQFLHFYPIKTGHLNMTNKTEQYFTAGNTLTTSTSLIYNPLNQPSTVTTTMSNGKVGISQTYYPGDYTSNDFTQQMRNLNMLDYPIENIQQVSSGAATTATTNGLATGGIYNQYLFHDNIMTPQNSFLFRTQSPVSFTPSAPLNVVDPHYQLAMSYTYNALGNLIEQQKINDLNEDYLWGYNSKYPVAKVVGSNIATVNGLIAQASLDAPTSDQQLRDYLNTSLRNQLKGSLVSTYTYSPLIGTTSSTDPKGYTSFYHYDQDQRLTSVQDNNGNIVKENQYGYAAGTVQNGAAAPFQNTGISQSFVKSNCSIGMMGTSWPYNVLAGTYHSYVSQADADLQAQYDLQTNGVMNANANAYCIAQPCSAPTISSVLVSGSSFTMAYTPTLGSYNVIFQIFDPLSGNQVSAPRISVSGGSITATVPTIGRTYTFKLLAVGMACQDGVYSNSYTVQF